MKNETLPRIKTLALLALTEGNALYLGNDRRILCLDDDRKVFEYQERAENLQGETIVVKSIPIAYDREEKWYCASWNARDHQYRSGDLIPAAVKRGWSYAYSRTLSGLEYTRNYPTPGALLRARLND